MAVIGLDIGNAYAYASVLEFDDNDVARETRDPMALVPDKYAGPGISTDAMVLPNGSIYVAPELESGSRPRIAPAQRAVIRAVKNLLRQDKIECTNRAGDLFAIETGSVYSEIVRRMVNVTNDVRATNHMEPVYEVVVAVPSIFSDSENTRALMEKVRACVEAVELNGHKLVLRGTIPEPAAVALDYLHYMQHIVEPSKRVNAEEYTVVVYDLGQGTFDTALTTVHSKDAQYELLHHDGLAYGGQNMDAVIFEHFMNQIGVVVQDEKQLARTRNSDSLMNLVSRVKETLSTDELWEEPYTVGGEVVDLRITREEFEEMIEDSIRDTVEQLQMMLNYAKRNGYRVDAIVMSGGCSSIPYVERQVSALAQKNDLPCSRYRPSKAVSFGAARYGRFQSLLKRSGYAYSLLLESTEKLDGELRQIIPVQQELPFKGEPIRLPNHHDGVFWVCRDLNKEDPADRDSLEDFKRMLRFRVDRPAGAAFQASFSMNDEYVIDVEVSESRN